MFVESKRKERGGGWCTGYIFILAGSWRICFDKRWKEKRKVG